MKRSGVVMATAARPHPKSSSTQEMIRRDMDDVSMVMMFRVSLGFHPGFFRVFPGFHLGILSG